MEEVKKRKLKPIIFEVEQKNGNSEEIIGLTKDDNLCNLPNYAKEEIGLEPGDLGQGFLKSITGRTKRGKDIMILFCISKVEEAKK